MYSHSQDIYDPGINLLKGAVNVSLDERIVLALHAQGSISQLCGEGPISLLQRRGS